MVLKFGVLLMVLLASFFSVASADFLKSCGKLSKNRTLVIPCSGGKCIQKCCGLNEYVIKGKKCGKYNGNLHFDKLKIYNEDARETNRNFYDLFNFTTNVFTDKNLRCMLMDYAVERFRYNHYLTEDGFLYVEQPNKWKRWHKYNSSQFCVDGLRSGGHSEIRFYSVGYVIEGDHQIIRQSVTRSSLINIGLMISCVCLLLVLLVYCLLAELRNLVGKILMSYVFSLLTTFFSLVVARINDGTVNSCMVLTLVIYFFMMASFAWMNIMSWDIWWTFRGYAKARFIHRRGELFKYFMYCLYAWGLPLTMTVAMLIIEHLELRFVPWLVKPDLYDNANCFLEGGTKVLYLYIPMMLMIISNWLFFLMTVYNVWRLHRSTAVLDTAAAGTPAAHRKQKYRLMVYLKLSIIMGINWALEVVSYYRPDDSLMYISDIYNVLIGAYIFCIYVCKRKILAKLVKKYHTCRQFRRIHYRSRFSDTSESEISQSLHVSTDPKGRKMILPIGHK